MCVCIYIYIYTHINVCIYIYIYFRQSVHSEPRCCMHTDGQIDRNGEIGAFRDCENASKKIVYTELRVAKKYFQKVDNIHLVSSIKKTETTLEHYSRNFRGCSLTAHQNLSLYVLSTSLDIVTRCNH